MKKRVNITLEDEVIERVDHFAEQHYTSRSGAITMLIVEGTNPTEKENEAFYEKHNGLYGGEYRNPDC